MRHSLLILFVWLLAGKAAAQQLSIATHYERGAAAVGPAEVTPEAVAPAALTYADEMPAFPGGDAAFHAYLRRTTAYPAEAQRLHQSGTVYVSFVVDEVGRVCDAAVAKGCNVPSLDQEALRLTRLMPWWSPGRNAGQAVRVRRTLPISFRVQNQAGG